MATIEKRKTKQGVERFAVKWRQGGRGGRDMTRTLPTKPEADAFCGLVKMCGNTMPDDDQLRAFGFGWMLGDNGDDDGQTQVPPMTVVELCYRFLDMKRKSLQAPSETTMYDYRGYIKNYVQPRKLGAMQAAIVHFSDIEDWEKNLMTEASPYGRKPLAANSVIKVRTGLVSPAFKWARSEKGGRLLTNDPFAEADMPKKDQTFLRALLFTPAEYGMFFHHARIVDPNWADMIEVVAATGMRFGEVAALAPTAVDRRRGMINLIRRLSRRAEIPGTKNGLIRQVPVPWHLMTRVIEPRLGNGRYVFTGPLGGRWSSAEWDRWDATRKRLANAGLSVHLTHHCLRHGYNTWLKSKKIDPDKIKKVMGHIDRSQSGRYDQLSEADLAEIRDAITELVTG